MTELFEKLKILHIIPTLTMGGAERLCLNICCQLNKEGHETLILVLNDAIEYKDLIGNLNVKIINTVVNLSPLNSDQSGLEELKKETKRFKPDLVHTHLYEAEIAWKATRLNIESVFHIHDNIKAFDAFAEGVFCKKSWVKFYEKQRYKQFLKKQSTHFLCISEDTKNYIQSNLKVAKGRIKFLHNAIDVNLFKYSKRRNLDAFKLITIGSLVPKKGHEYLLRVVDSLKKKTSLPIFLDVLGDGIELNSLKELVISLDLEINVKFHGKVNNPEQFLKEANFYIHGAYEEPFGLVLIEAMASGLPVLSTDGGGNRDIIVNNSNGYMYYNRSNSNEMADKLIELINNEEKYAKISSNASTFSLNFGIEEYCKRLVDLYYSLK